MPRCISSRFQFRAPLRGLGVFADSTASPAAPGPPLPPIFNLRPSAKFADSSLLGVSAPLWFGFRVSAVLRG